MTQNAELLDPRTGASTSRAGSGYSEDPDSRSAGIEAARAALARAGTERCDLALVYATSRHDPAALLEGVRSVVGREARIVGGYSVGSITNDRVGFDGYQVGVGIVDSRSLEIEVFVEGGLDRRGEQEVGRALGRKIAAAEYQGEPNLVLMYDSVKRSQAELNMATDLVAGMSEAISPWPRMAGVGVFGNLQFTETHTWVDDTVLTQSALALVLHGGVRMDTIILHGCQPSGRYHTITRAEGPVVLEIDGRPALEFIQRMVPDKTWEEYPLFLTLGVNKGDKFGEFDEEEYANRLCMAVDRERGALVMFEPDLKTGSEVQLMRRSIDFGYIRQRIDALFERLGDRRPLFALYIDCAGRASAICGSDGEEAEEVQSAFNARGVPLLGMYSGVEIARVGADVQALDWTGVLCLFSE